MRLAHKRLLATAMGTTMIAAFAACAPESSSDDAADYPSKSLSFIVPAAPGGGWDSTARQLQQTMKSAKLVDQSIDVINRDGGGGATGLSQIVTKDKGDPYTLMVGGLVMIGALEQANSPLKVSDATAIATVTAETEAIVVRSDSPYKSIDDVIAAYKKDPRSVAFGGGSVGGSDQLVLGQLIQVAGGTPKDMKYIPYAGGGEAIAGILSGDVEVGVSGLSEFLGQIEGGKMRLLAISSDEKREVAGEEAPTLKGEGYDVDFVNWRAVYAPPGISADERDGITALIDKVHESKEWKDVLAKQGWADFYKSGDEATDFMKSEETRVKSVMKDLGL